MPGKVRRFSRRSLRLNEATVRLAENLATRFGVTVQEFIEALLLEIAGQSIEPRVQPRQSGEAARLIDLDEARQRRIQPTLTVFRGPPGP